MAIKHPKFQSVLPVTIFKEGKMFVAHSPALDLSSCGRTFEEAQTHFKEAADIFFRECVRRGTLGDVLASLGWRKISKSPAGFLLKSSGTLTFPSLPALEKWAA